MSGMDLKAVDSLRAYIREMYPKFKQNLEADGQLIPTNFIVVTRNPHTDEELEAPAIMVVVTPYLPNNSAKNALSDLLRQLINKTKAIAIVSVMESWAIMEDNPTPEQIESIKKYVDTNRSIENHPDAKEVIMISLEHYRLEGTEMIYAPISRDPDNKPVVGDFIVKPPVPLKGRFSGMLHTLN